MKEDSDQSIHLELDEELTDVVDGAVALVSDDESVVSSATTSDTTWDIVKRCDTEDTFVDFLYTPPFRMVATHGNQRCKCSLHDGHKQVYGYYSCSSVKCFAAEGDTCSFRLKVCYSVQLSKVVVKINI